MPSKTLNHVRAITHTVSPRCVNRCGFCPFPNQKYRAAPSLKRWRQLLRRSRPWEPTALHLTGGEPITKDRDLLQTVRYYGYRDAIEYLQAILTAAQDTHHGGLLASVELGEVRRADLLRLRPLIAEYVVGIVPFDPSLFGDALLWNSPTMVPPRRLDLIQTLGQLRIPTTVRMLVGLGECEASRIQTLAALGEIHANRAHLQAIQIAPFRPVAGTPLETQPAADADLIVRTVRRAAELLGPVPIQVPALEVQDFLERCVDAGAEDLGLISIDPEQGIEPAIGHWESLEKRLEQGGHRSMERLVLTESSVARGLYPQGMAPAIAHQLERLENRLARGIVAPVTEPAVGDSAEASA